MKRHALTNAEWEAVKDLAHYKPARGPEPAPESIRPYLNGICWILATGAPWRDLPPEFGPWESVYTRFRAYIREEVFDQIIERLQRGALEKGNMKLQLSCFDGTYIRAHRHAAGARQKKQATRKPTRRPARRNKLLDAPEEDTPPRST